MVPVHDGPNRFELELNSFLREGQSVAFAGRVRAGPVSLVSLLRLRGSAASARYSGCLFSAGGGLLCSPKQLGSLVRLAEFGSVGTEFSG